MSSDDLLLFNRMVTAFEEEAYDILKSRSCEEFSSNINAHPNVYLKMIADRHLFLVGRSSPVQSPKTGHAPRRHLIPAVTGELSQLRRSAKVLSCVSFK